MTIVGFDSGAEVQPEGAITGLRAFFSGLPITGTLIAMIVMRNYNVDEERANEVRAELEKRKTGKKDTYTSYYQKEKFLSLKNIPSLSTDIDFANKSNSEIRQLFGETLNRGLYGMSFSPYLEGQNIGDILSAEQIQKRMAVITPYTKWVRSFSCTEGNEHIPKSARNSGLKTMVGAWIDSNRANNEKEIEALISLAQKGLVDIAVVGNEVLLRNDLTEQELITYIQRVKRALPNIPVGYVDAYYQFREHPALVDACDLVLANCYPFWEGCHIDRATGYLKQMYTVAKEAAKGKPVIITETGWPDQGSANLDAQPSPNNAMRYFINTQNWARQENIELFYFSSFDESWKIRHEGDVGQRWGIWDKNENLKYK
jgi:GPH family glycoside/pentoside/hexuronide:cation symporter